LGLASCAEWHVVQGACCATAWSPGSCATAWQLAHGGGDGVPSGPCARWQVVQSATARPCSVFGLSVWQVAQLTGLAFGSCVAWQPSHRACPAGADDASAWWQVAQNAAVAVGFGPCAR
jgi:hypothetical protein